MRFPGAFRKGWWRLQRATSNSAERDAATWALRREEHRAHLDEGIQTWRYLELVRRHTNKNVNWFKAIPFFALPLAVGARRMVELGSSFSYYPETYQPRSPWGISKAVDEGVVSTRLMLAAARLLTDFGVHSTVTSVDLRDSSLYKNARQLLTELDLIRFWDPKMATDSIGWLNEEQQRLRRGEVEPIDFGLIDSNHTYDQVSRELAGILPLMSAKGVLLVDDCWTTNYKHGADWVPEESEEGIKRGGEYGAVLEFLEQHPNWQAEWIPEGMAILSRPARVP